MMLVEIVPWLAAFGFIAFAWAYASGAGSRMRGAWMFPAGLSVLFFAFSLAAVVLEGPFGFWHVGSASLWGNQVWIDLLLAIGVAWTLIVPQAKAIGMRVLPWLVLILFTGCIGLLAMLARFLYLEERTGAASTHPRRAEA